MSYIIKISKPGYDVKNTTDENLVFSSDYANPKIAQSGNFSINAVSTETEYSVTIMHNLGYNPLCIAFAETSPGGGKKQMLNTSNVQAAWSLKIYADRIIITFWMNATGTTGMYNGYYYLFEEVL